MMAAHGYRFSEEKIDNDKRNGMAPVPVYYKPMLTARQLLALDKIRQYGWELYFIRRLGARKALVVVRNRIKNVVGVLEKGGNIDLKAKIRLRDDSWPAFILKRGNCLS